MKKLLALSFLIFLSVDVFSWGQIGHRVVGLIAERHLNKKAAKKLEALMQNETLAEVSTYMDFIRSDKKYNHMSPWHYCTIPNGKTYAEAGTPEQGDVIVAIERLIGELKSKKFTDEDELFALKCLVHLIGDIHQPLHVGNGNDRGGNDIKVSYFWEDSNLHRVWDSGIIDQQQYSYTEYADWIDHASVSDIAVWQKQGVRDWAKESYDLRDQVYDFPENKKLTYRYNFDNIEALNKRLLQAGIRLAGVLNEIYGS